MGLLTLVVAVALQLHTAAGFQTPTPRLSTSWAIRRAEAAPSSDDSAFPPPPSDDLVSPPPPPPLPTPTSFAEAERFGLDLFQAADYGAAKTMFEKSVSLKGTGWDLTRIRSASSSPVGGAANQGGGFVRQEFASKEEIQCAKYNIACCQVKLGDKAGALATVAEVLESGFDEYETMRRDSTLAALGPDLDALLAQAQKNNFNPLSNVMGLFQKKLK